MVGFQAYSFGTRLETGYCFATPVAGITGLRPVAVQNFITPSYSEVAAAGSPTDLELSFNERSTTSTRAELGAIFDKLFDVKGGQALALRRRTARGGRRPEHGLR